MEEIKKLRKRWFLRLRSILRLFIKKTEFVNLGEEVKPGGIILSNHDGAKGPLAFELYSNLPFRFWGTYEMNSNLKSVYIYLSKIYFTQKKKWNIHLARLLCIIAAPLLNIYYKGLNLISTYPDMRLKKTLSESIEVLKNNHNLVIFPEMSEDGYFKELVGFHDGVVFFFEYCLKKNINAPIYVAYYQRDKKKCIIDKPVYIKDLLDLGLSREELAKKLCDRCNELGVTNI